MLFLYTGTSGSGKSLHVAKDIKRHLSYGFGYRILFVTQFDRMIGRQIRCLAEYEVKHRTMDSFGIRGKIASLLAFGQLFCAVAVYYGMDEKTGARFFRGRRSLYRLYDTPGAAGSKRRLGLQATA